MNERIRELADQILPNEKEFHQGDPKDWGYFFSRDELEKFAELIVKECVSLFDGTQEMKTVGVLTHNQVVGQIKQHFGVE